MRAFFGDPPFNEKATVLVANFDPAVDDQVLNIVPNVDIYIPLEILIRLRLSIIPT